MRCYCCDRPLSDYESVLRHPTTLEFLDTCKKCLKDIPIKPLEPQTIADETTEDGDDYLEHYLDEEEDDNE